MDNALLMMTLDHMVICIYAYDVNQTYNSCWLLEINKEKNDHWMTMNLPLHITQNKTQYFK